jgi:xanthine dehydrogenase large subunit
VLTYEDVPGDNDISPSEMHDDPVLAVGKVQFHGQPIFCVIAKTREQARRACAAGQGRIRGIAGRVSTSGTSTRRRIARSGPPLTLKRGDAAAAIDGAPRRLKGRMRLGGQDHFYLEGQVALAVPGEDDEVTVYCSTQHPSEVQHMVAHALGVPSHAVTVEVRRMGGGFGGKETQSNQFAALAAIAAKKLGRAVKIRPDRDEDMTATGKRHDFAIDYDVGFDDEGRILGIDYTSIARAAAFRRTSPARSPTGRCSTATTPISSRMCRPSRAAHTNTVSNTAFRGFGGPQGMVGAERVIEEVAFAVGKDPLDIRKLNFYDAMGVSGDRCDALSPEGGRLHHPAHRRRARRERRLCRQAARRLPRSTKSRIVKRGMALTPVKFGISFTKTESTRPARWCMSTRTVPCT